MLAVPLAVNTLFQKWILGEFFCHLAVYSMEVRLLYIFNLQFYFTSHWIESEKTSLLNKHEIEWTDVFFVTFSIVKYACFCYESFEKIFIINCKPQSSYISTEYDSVCSLVELGPPQTSVSNPPPFGKRGDTLAADEGVGRSQFGRLEKKPSILSTLCWKLSQRRELTANEEEYKKGDLSWHHPFKPCWEYRKYM